MANIKTSLEFYRVDTNRYQDIRIKRLKKAFHGTGIAVYDYILCEIYRVRGCYIVWDESTVFDVAEYFDLKESQVKEIVNYCCSVGLFDKELLVRGSVLSSSAIQRRYIEMCTAAKRKEIIVPEQYRILPEESGIITEHSSNIHPVCRKGKKSKVKNRESSDEDSLRGTPDGDPHPVAEKINFKDLVAFFNTETKGVFGEIRYPLNEKRMSSVRARIREHGKSAFAEMVHKAAASDFLKGGGKTGFKATFDWLIQPSNFQKVIEGNYANQTTTTNRGGADCTSANERRYGSTDRAKQSITNRIARLSGQTADNVSDGGETDSGDVGRLPGAKADKP